MKSFLAAIVVFTFAASAAFADKPSLSGHYLEVRTCDVFTGPCFANAEMGLTGKEGMLVWSIQNGAWNGTPLDGLTVIAVVQTPDTLGDLKYNPQSGKAVLIVDSKATSSQRMALADFAKHMAGPLVSEIVDVKASSVQTDLGVCKEAGCATVKADGLVEITTRCLGSKDHLCGNDEVFYPPMTDVQNPTPAFSEIAAYSGDGLNVTWAGVGQRNAFLGTFAR